MKRLFALALCLILGGAALAQSIPFPGPGMPASGGGVPMVTPILSMGGGGAGASPSNSVVNYSSLTVGQVGSYTGTLGARAAVIPISGTISNLYVRFPTAIVSGSWDIALMVNGVFDANFTCQVNSGAGTCTDVTHTVAVTAGQTLEWRFTPTSTPTANSSIQVSATFTSSANGEGFLLGTALSAPSTSVKNYLSFGGSKAYSATEVNVSNVIPTAGTIDNLYVKTFAAPGAAKSYDYTLFKNGIATSLTCQITGAGTTTCSDTNPAHAVSVVAADTISIETSPTGTPTANVNNVGVRWVPTIPGESLALSVTAAVPGTTGASRGNLNGAFNATSTEASAINYAPIGFTVKKLYAAQDAAPGVGTSRKIAVRKGTGGGQSDAFSCTVGAAATDCNDTSSTYAATAADFLNIETTATGTNAALAYMKTGVVLYIP